MSSRKPFLFYGWYIVFAGTATMTLMATFSYYGMGIFLEPIRSHFGWSTLAFTTGLSLARLEGGFLAPFVGYFIDKYGPRKLMLAGISVCGLGYLLLSQTMSLPYFFLVYIVLIQGGISLGMGNAPTTAVANWFQRRRGTAMGIVNLGASFGGIFSAPLAWIITSFKWNGALIVAGITVWIIGLPMALIVRHKPEPYGYLPDGRIPINSDISDSKNVETSEEDVEINFTAKQALKTMAFWSIGLTFAARQLVTGSVALFLVPLLQERGMSLTEAASIITLMSFIGMPGRVGFAWLGDKYDKRWVMATCFIFQSIGLILFIILGGNIGITFFLILYAPAYSGVLPLLPAIQADYFGRNQFATIRGLMAPVGTASVVLGPIIVGIIHNFFNSYEPAFFVLAVSNIMALIFIVLTKRPVLHNN